MFENLLLKRPLPTFISLCKCKYIIYVHEAFMNIFFYFILSSQGLEAFKKMKHCIGETKMTYKILGLCLYTAYRDFHLFVSMLMKIFLLQHSFIQESRGEAAFN